MHLSAIHFETKGAAQALEHSAGTLTGISIRAILNSANSLNTALYYVLMFNTVYNIFNSFYVLAEAD